MVIAANLETDRQAAATSYRPSLSSLALTAADALNALSGVHKPGPHLLLLLELLLQQGSWMLSRSFLYACLFILTSWTEIKIHLTLQACLTDADGQHVVTHKQESASSRVNWSLC